MILVDLQEERVAGGGFEGLDSSWRHIDGDGVGDSGVVGGDGHGEAIGLVRDGVPVEAAVEPAFRVAVFRVAVAEVTVVGAVGKGGEALVQAVFAEKFMPFFDIIGCG